MSRIRCPEIADQPWCPGIVRSGITDALQFFLCLFNQYGCVGGLLRRALDSCGTTEVLDLCSGSGGPWMRLLPQLDAEGGPRVHITLTDRSPNSPALARHAKRFPGRISAHPAPVDATALPPGARGFRTCFSAFHHFDPGQARAILADAIRNREGIGVFELTNRSVANLLTAAIVPLPLLTFTPGIRPFRWWRIVFTYVIPVIPVAMVWDGIASCLSTYSPRELQGLVRSLGDCGYRWECGVTGTGPQPVTYLIGVPEKLPG